MTHTITSLLACMFLLLTVWPAETAADTDAALDAVQINASLLAYWPFDEEENAAIAFDAAPDSKHSASAEHSLPRGTGVFGKALELKGRHALRVESFGLAAPEEIAFSVWCRPTDLSGYRELFRQESNHRVLFSVQADGTVLSLGLDIDGYIECDAPIDSMRAADGAWHHCAAVYDGRHMRVYFDGEEIGALERPGRVSWASEAPAFIGSSGGTVEHFQGRLDDFRIYGGALDPSQIAALHAAGQSALHERMQRSSAQVDQCFPSGRDFAETLAALREDRANNAAAWDEDADEALARRLSQAFPDECRGFADWCGSPPLAYIADGSDQFHHERIALLMELLTEYKPITDEQWAEQSQDDLRRWEEADALRERFDLLRASGTDSRFSPEWVRLAMESGSRIHFRPRVHEAVAPYITPNTAETRRRTPEEARRLLENDWRHQAKGVPLHALVRSELRWTRDLADRIERDHPGRVDFSECKARLRRIAKQALALPEPDEGIYFELRQLKREMLLANPAVNFNQVLFVDMPLPQGSEWPHETRHRLGYMAVPGGKLVVLEGLEPGGEVRQLAPQSPMHGSFWRPDVDYDGEKVLFCFKPHNEKAFHLYEINADGSGLSQLTRGSYDDLDPVYLPDGEHIAFSTTRGHTYVRCMPPTSAFVLARAKRSGDGIYLISANNEPDYLPSVLHDGRIVYTRWEYTDKPLWRAQSLWTVNPDGSQSNTLWGNQSVWPDLLKDARAIPGSRRVMFTGSAHHQWFHGSVGIIDPDRGLNFPDGLTKVTADVEWPESGNGPVDPIESPNYHASGLYNAYYSPYPLGEKDFLVSADRDGKFVLYLMDVDGNRELLYEGDNHVLHAMPLAPRPRPPVLAERVRFPSAEERSRPDPGVIFSGNVYQGAPDSLRGKARYLRILNIDHKTYTYWYKRPLLSTGPVVSAVQSEGVKRILGTVPIEPDGSVSFYAPSGIPLHFQLLDAEQRALQTMRSFVNVMPGESRGCLGCHELHSRAPESHSRAAALARPPLHIAPPPWKDDSVSYPRYVRPVLDRYCAECHEGDGEGRKAFDTTERPGTPLFSEPYLTIIGRPSWGAPYVPPENPPPGFGIAGQLMVEGYDQRDPAAYQTPEPMTALSYRSRLVDIASSGKHYGVTVDEISRLRLIAWVDAMTPYQGLEEIRSMPDPEFQGIDWLAVRPRIQSAPTIIRPGPVD